MRFDNLLVDISDGVLTLTVNRPQALNALNSELLGDMEAAFAAIEGDRGIKVVILTGAGEKAFVAGGDIKEMAAMNAGEAHRFALRGQRILLSIERLPQPVIAAVNGFALGGGLELALACDFIYASATARFGFPEVTLGVIPGFGGTQNLARLIGRAKAAELIFGGRIIGAEKACAWGIVNEVVPPEELMSKARETAAAIARAGSLAVARAKDALVNGLNMGKEEGFRYEASQFGLLFATEDQKEGMAAFVEKRKASFLSR